MRGQRASRLPIFFCRSVWLEIWAVAVSPLSTSSILPPWSEAGARNEGARLGVSAPGRLTLGESWPLAIAKSRACCVLVSTISPLLTLIGTLSPVVELPPTTPPVAKPFTVAMMLASWAAPVRPNASQETHPVLAALVMAAAYESTIWPMAAITIPAFAAPVADPSCCMALPVAAAKPRMAESSCPTPLTANPICPNMLTSSWYGAMAFPMAVCRLANAICAFFTCPASVLASLAFMFPTLSVMACANVVAFVYSSPVLMSSFWWSVRVIPTLVSAPTLPINAFPMRLAPPTASSLVALSPFCCARRLFMAGKSASSVCLWLANVASCWRPLLCTVPRTIPSLVCAATASLIAAVSASVAPMRCRMMVVSFVCASAAEFALAM